MAVRKWVDGLWLRNERLVRSLEGEWVGMWQISEELR